MDKREAIIKLTKIKEEVRELESFFDYKDPYMNELLRISYHIVNIINHIFDGYEYEFDKMAREEVCKEKN